MAPACGRVGGNWLVGVLLRGVWLMVGRLVTVKAAKLCMPVERLRHEQGGIWRAYGTSCIAAGWGVGAKVFGMCNSRAKGGMCRATAA